MSDPEDTDGARTDKDGDLHIDTSDAGGTTQSLDDIDQDEVEKVREERLDADNRPEGAEVDNTEREFDHEKGAFTDSDDYDELEPRFAEEEDLGSGGEDSERA